MNQLFIRALSRVKLLKKFNVSSSIKINNRSFRIPVIKTIGRDNLVNSEKWMITVLGKLVSIKKGSFIDVGVNIGQTLLRIKSIDTDIKYIGFEPNPICVFYIDELIKQNQLKDVAIFPVAVSNKTGITELNFYHDVGTDSTASIIKDFRPWQEVYRKAYISCFTMQNFTEFIDFSIVGIIKIDVEGAELEVLDGLAHCIEKARPNIIMEILPVYKQENIDRFNRQLQIEYFLKEHSYKILRIIKTEMDEFSHFEPVEEIGIHSNLDLTNYVFIPKERAL